MIRAKVDLGMNDFVNFELSFDEMNLQELLKKSKVWYDKYGTVRIELFDEYGWYRGLIDVFESEHINIIIWPYGIALFRLSYENCYFNW